MQVEPIGLLVVGIATVLGHGELRRRLRAAVDRAAVPAHPLSHPLQAVESALVELSPACRTDVQQEDPALADAIDQHPDQLVDALPALLVAVVAPGAGEGLARLPDDRLTGHMHPAPRHELLGGLDILIDLQAVVDEDAGLERAHQLDELLTLPLVLALTGHAVAGAHGEVVPEDVDFAELGEKLACLAMQIFDVALEA